MLNFQTILKLDKSLEISEKMIELLNQECDNECQIHAMMCTRIKLYYNEAEEIVNECLKNNTNSYTLHTRLKENYNRHVKIFENVLTRFKEMDDLIELNYSVYKENIAEP